MVKFYYVHFNTKFLKFKFFIFVNFMNIIKEIILNKHLKEIILNKHLKEIILNILLKEIILNILLKEIILNILLKEIILNKHYQGDNFKYNTQGYILN